MIVVLPGILGSTLQDQAGDQVFGPPPFKAILHPGRLHIDERLNPVALLDDATFFGRILVSGYSGQIRDISNALGLRESDIDVAVDGTDPNTSARVMLFPYDFRQGMQRNAERLAQHISARRGNRRVMILAHSMGGLVARWWWACEGGWQVCDHLYTMGTPHRGAAQALSFLGLGVRKFGVRFKIPTEVISSWPSVYELLPRYKAVWDGETWLYPHELPSTASGLDTRSAEGAWKTHHELEEAVEIAQGNSPGLVFRALRSYHHPTPAWGWLDKGILRVGKQPPVETPEESTGDGTVPWFSALPVDYDSDDAARAMSYTVPTVARHRRLMTTEQALAPLNARNTSAIRGPGGPEPASLALDLDDFVEAGTIPISVRPILPEGEAVTSMIAQTRDHRTTLEFDGESWSGSLPATAEGTYTVRVSATVAGGPSLEVRDTVEVLQDDQ